MDIRSSFMKNIVLSIYLLFLLVGCEPIDRKKILYISDAKGENWITHISNNDIQYIINGRVEYVPDTNYVILDVSRKELKIDNSFFILWNDSIKEKKWSITMARSGLLVSKLDTNKFYFATEFPKDSTQFPRFKFLFDRGFGVVDVELESVYIDKIKLEKGEFKKQRLLSYVLEESSH